MIENREGVRSALLAPVSKSHVTVESFNLRHPTNVFEVAPFAISQMSTPMVRSELPINFSKQFFPSCWSERREYKAPLPGQSPLICTCAAFSLLVHL